MTTAPQTTERQLRLPAGAHVADRRGLTATGAIAVAIGAGIAGGTIDVITGAGLRTVFAICFIAGCAVAAYKVHREDLAAAVVIPPLAYVALAVAANVGARGLGGPAFLRQQVLELVAALVLRAPVVMSATLAAAVVALVRWLGARKPG